MTMHIRRWFEKERKVVVSWLHHSEQRALFASGSNWGCSWKYTWLRRIVMWPWRWWARFSWNANLKSNKRPCRPYSHCKLKDESMWFNRSGCIAVVLHEKSSNIAWRPQGGGMCPDISAGKKRTVSSKVDANFIVQFWKFLNPKRAKLFRILVRPREGVKSAFICNLCYLKTNNNGILYYHTTSKILSANIKTLELFLALIRQKMLENSKFIVFPVIRLKFGVRVNLRG